MQRDLVWDALSTVKDKIIKVEPIHMKKDTTLTIRFDHGDPTKLVAHKDMTINAIRLRQLVDGTTLYTLIESNE